MAALRYCRAVSAATRRVPVRFRTWGPSGGVMSCAAIGLSVGIAISLAAPPGVDAPAHLFQTWAFTHFGFTIWNNYW